MEATREGAWTPRRIAREQAGLAGALVGLAVVAWVLADHRTDGMAMGSAMGLGGLGFYTGVWVVMTAAMMFPSVWPVVGMYDHIRATRGVAGTGTPLVVIGYVAVWTVWGLAAFGAIRLAHALLGDFLPWDGAGRWVAAGVVLGAAVYQRTPVKNACLTRCRAPFLFVMAHWRGGMLGAFRLGAVHGAWCVGCCWALMAALFALGVMSLAWMALIAALIGFEKLSPSRSVASWSVVGVLLLLSVGLASGSVS
jgi:predicted metal-binding membrane protein